MDELAGITALEEAPLAEPPRKDNFQLTAKQAAAIQLARGEALHLMLYGGARSGKTVVILLMMIYRACRFPGSRHLIARWRQVHAKVSIWHESLLPLLRLFATVGYTVNYSEARIDFHNGSEIWVGGLDDKERLEKLLGREFSTIYLNEVSQISYDAVLILQPRLAQMIPGCRNRMFYDCNPPSPLHWCHKVFIEKRDPKTGLGLTKPGNYASMRMNPADNAANLPANYIEDFLDPLSESARKRFRDGEFMKAEGVIYNKFDALTMLKPFREAPWGKMELFTAGLDFGIHMASVLCGWQGDRLWFLDDHGGLNQTTSSFNRELTRRWGRHLQITYCDPAGGERIQEVYCGYEANNAVEPGIDYLNGKMERGEFFVTDRCSGWLSEVDHYIRDDNGKVIKSNDHFMDAGRYGSFSYGAGGIVALIG